MKLISKDIAKFVSVFEKKLKTVSKRDKLLTLALAVILAPAPVPVQASPL